jgi:N-acetylneuraminic acid mutarotase
MTSRLIYLSSFLLLHCLIQLGVRAQTQLLQPQSPVQTLFAINNDTGWTTKASMPTARYYFGTGVINGKLYVVGGATTITGGTPVGILEVYDPISNTWATKAPMPTIRRELSAATVNGILYAIGGVNNNGNQSKVEAYNPVTNTWTTKASMPTARSQSEAEVIGGKIYVVGGIGPSVKWKNNLEVYDPASDTWATKQVMPVKRGRSGSGIINGSLYVAGGVNTYVLDIVQAYDPVANAWSTKTSLPSIRQFCGSGVINNVLYVVGGRAGWNTPSTNLQASMVKYDAANNIWIGCLPMPTARFGLSCEVINGILYAVGGANYGGTLNKLEAFTPSE